MAGDKESPRPSEAFRAAERKLVDLNRGSYVLAGWRWDGPRAMRSGRRRATLGIGIAVVVVASATAAYLVRDRLFTGPISEQSIQPEFITPIGSDGSLVNVEVGFPWSEQGYCAGQFHVKASETSTEVSVGSIISRTYSQGICAGIGSNGRWATAPLSLKSPIGKRSVVRKSNGAALPVFALTVMLRCQDAIHSQATADADQITLFNEVALPKNSLQANRSGEPDPSARFFAKSGLEIASGSTFTLSVPDDWMGRASIGWGSSQIRTMHLYVPACHEVISGNRWLVFAGGFWAAEPSCVPLGVNSGIQQETVQIGVGTACPGQAPPPPGA